MSHKAAVPKAAIIRKIEFSPKTYEYETYKPHSENSTLGPKQKELYEACACLTLVGPSTPLPVAYWTEIEKWVPCAILLGEGWSSPIYDVKNVKNYLIKNEDVFRAQEIYEIFSQLSPEIREKLRVPLGRLNQAIRRLDLVDKAIDLGIALEALFLSDRSHTEQIAFTFRLRGAWFMAEDAQKRQELILIFDKLYDCRSRAIHSGRLDDKINIKRKPPIPTQEFLEQGIKLCVDAIEKILRKGCFPEWGKVILGI
jgi:hypothetical protein